MLNLISGILKLAIFAAIVLILGNTIRWRGHTISDEIRTRVSHAEQVFGDSPAARATSHVAIKATSRSSSSRFNPEAEQISPSERQKLKALIQELNGSRRHD